MQRSYDIVLDYTKSDVLYQIVTDIDGDAYILNHDRGRFDFIWDWDFMNTVIQELESLDETRDDVWYIDYDLLDEVWKCFENDDEERFWKLYDRLGLEEFNSSISEKRK